MADKIPLIIPGLDPLPFSAREVIEEKDKIIIVQPDRLETEVIRVQNARRLRNSLFNGNTVTLCVQGVPVARGYMRQMEIHNDGIYEEQSFGRMAMVRSPRMEVRMTLEEIDYDEIMNKRKTNPASFDPTGFAW